VAGILVRNTIAGIGINVNHTSFPSELASEATSLRLQTGAPVSLTGIILTLLPAVDRFVELDKDTIVRLFTHASSYAAGRRVTVAQPDGIIEGTTAGLDPAGFLIVRQDDGTDTLILAGGVRAAGS
jgi:BirA family biotin operon repressor/biotin-[acetyl-CoA-carboxylase] ligase